jgi:septum formation protein
MSATRPPAHDWIWLASQSPRRQALLAQIGVRLQRLEPDPDEDVESLEAERPGEAPRAYVQRVTAAKLDAALARVQRRSLERAPVLCADTTVAVGRTLLAKPRDAADAVRMLRLLSGREHRVLTSVAVGWPARGGFRVAQVVQVSTVRFARLGAADIAAYVATGEPFGKAGAYGIQGRAAVFVERIGGSHSSIMGLPLHETAVLLRRAGVRF